LLPDAHLVDASPGVDGSPKLDALPPVDVVNPPDAPACPTGQTAYLVSQSGDLYSFDPTTLATRDLGALTCAGTVPWTLTASSAGIVYVLYEDWKIYAVDPATLACKATPYVPGQLSLAGEDTLTVAPVDGGEELYVYGQTTRGKTLLAVGGLVDFSLSRVGWVKPEPTQFPLDVRADAFGHIFGLSETGLFVQIDRETAALVAEDTTTFASGGSWALLTYNDAIYFFAGGDMSRYDPTTKKVTPIGNVGVAVVGASAAPCIH